ncbi:hypothetical protein VMCG_04565 [Cytospora schulzeri]|uniref:Major facilitator superfamily (MFS) profile domain-containing protein n=1 Tax=Cytospora schulzeri TaxID=448051 RepID=A0A423WRM3_9PEZI|nr:hypothetical protein VMCG_04565 [Valsa malicola]
MKDTEAVNRVPEQTSRQEMDPPTKQDEKGSERLSVPAGTGEGDYPTGLGLVFVVAALILAIFLTSLDTAYGFISLKITYLVAIFIFEIGSLVCAVAPSSVALIVGRAIAGLGAAGVNTGSFILAAFSAPPRKRPIFTGLIGLSYGFQTIGAAFMQSGAAAAFDNQMLLYLPRTAPEVDPTAVVAVGATELESFGSSLHGVRIAYMDGLKVAYALSCASVGVACILSLFSRREKIEGEAAKNVMGAA